MDFTTRRGIIDYCLTFPDAYEDYPFDDPAGDNPTAVIRHRANRKMFALVALHGGKPWLNLKCDPVEAVLLRQTFKSVIPGWHQSHEHWNTVMLGEGCDVPEAEIERMVHNSYGLIKPKGKRAGKQTKP